MTNWLKEIEERETKATPEPWFVGTDLQWVMQLLPDKPDTRYLLKGTAASVDDLWFSAHARQDIPTLLRACNAYRKAIEEAPHPQGYCAKWSHHWREGWELENSKDCSCWKSKALAYDPTKEVN